MATQVIEVGGAPAIRPGTLHVDRAVVARTIRPGTLHADRAVVARTIREAIWLAAVVVLLALALCGMALAADLAGTMTPPAGPAPGFAL